MSRKLKKYSKEYKLSLLREYYSSGMANRMISVSPGGISSTSSMFPGHMPVSASNTYMPTDITRISMSATSSTSNIIDY